MANQRESFCQVHWKPKPCKAYMELPVSQFPQGKTCFHYRELLVSTQGPCFHCRNFSVNPCTSLLEIVVHQKKHTLFFWKSYINKYVHHPRFFDLPPLLTQLFQSVGKQRKLQFPPIPKYWSEKLIQIKRQKVTFKVDYSLAVIWF